MPKVNLGYQNQVHKNSRHFSHLKYFKYSNLGGLAQLARALDLHSRGQGFDSPILHNPPLCGKEFIDILKESRTNFLLVRKHLLRNRLRKLIRAYGGCLGSQRR